MQSQKIHAKLIIEIAGAPKEHIDNTIKLLAEQFCQEKGITVLGKKLSETTEVKIGNITRQMFSSFIELDISFSEIEVLNHIMFVYMPSHVEIISPETINISSDGMSELYTSLAARLHHSDNLVKKLKAQTVIIAKELEKAKQAKENS